jgi:hypothetical protein
MPLSQSHIHIGRCVGRLATSLQTRLHYCYPLSIGASWLLAADEPSSRRLASHLPPSSHMRKLTIWRLSLRRSLPGISLEQLRPPAAPPKRFIPN